LAFSGKSLSGAFDGRIILNADTKEALELKNW
jgi:hypothetical protein